MGISYKKLWVLLIEKDICEYLECDIGDICSVVKPQKEDNV